MRAACAALVTAGVVPFSALPLVHLVLFCLHSGSPFEAVAPSHERSAALAQEDVCAGGSCSLNALQQHAKGTRAAGATKRIISRHNASSNGRPLVELSLEELDELVRKGDHSIMDLFNDTECNDKVEGCDQLVDRWYNCMDIDTRKVPRDAGRSSDPVKFLRYNCRESCGYCGNENQLRLSEFRMIRNDMVDTQLSYAKAGKSDMPEELLGIFWMDQRASNREGMKCDPEYYNNFNFENNAVNEILFTTGDGAEWNPETKCVRGVAHTGRQGHWTYMNEGTKEGNTLFYQMNFPARMGGHFCQVTDTEWDIPIKVVPSNADELRAWSMVSDPDERGFFAYPDWLMRFRMKRTCFGFARKTTVGAEWLMPNGPLYYPIFRIVDGHGKRTEHWDAYINFTNSVGKNCVHDTIADIYGGPPCSIGNGMQYVPVMTKSFVPRGNPGHQQQEYLRLYDTGRLAKR